MNTTTVKQRFGDLAIGDIFLFSGTEMKKTNLYNALSTGERNKRNFQFSKSNLVQKLIQNIPVEEDLTEISDFSKYIFCPYIPDFEKKEEKEELIVPETNSGWRHIAIIQKENQTTFFLNGLKIPATSKLIKTTDGTRLFKLNSFPLNEHNVISGIRIYLKSKSYEYIDHLEIMIGNDELCFMNIKKDSLDLNNFEIIFWYDFSKSVCKDLTIYSRNFFV